MGDYVGDITPHAKIQGDRSGGGVPANGWNITLAWFLVVLWSKFCSHPRLNRRSDFDDVWFIGRQSQVIAFLEAWNCKRFQFSPNYTPKTTQRGVNRHFQKPNAQNIENRISSKLYNADSNQILHSDKDHQVHFMGGPNTRKVNQDSGRSPS